MHELGGRRSGYQSPEVVLAEARRLAGRILAEAERDAASIRREAASWAANARAEADALRAALSVELSSQRALPPAPAAHRVGVSYDDIPPPPPPPSEHARPFPTGEGTLTGDVIDLRAAAAAHPRWRITAW